MTVWITAALKAELNLLRGRLGAAREGRTAGYPWYAGTLYGRPVRLGVTGIGVASAALAMGAFFSVERPELALMTGTAGALPDSNLAVGHLVIADVEILAELGAAREAGIGDAASLRLPGTSQELSFDPALTAGLARASACAAPVLRARVLTVVGISARVEQAFARARRFRAAAENMEGYALALAANRFAVPAAEVRGISNTAGDRDRSRWDFPTAQVLAQEAVLGLLRSCP